MLIGGFHKYHYKSGKAVNPYQHNEIVEFEVEPTKLCKCLL